MTVKSAKSGKEVLEDFFSKITEVPGVDEDAVKSILDLYKADKLSAKNLSNSLAAIREKGNSDEN